MEESRQEKIKQYRDQLKNRDVTADDLLIGSWISFYPFSTDPFEYQVRQLADAGINFNIFPSGYLGGNMESAAHWETVESLYAANNMVYFMNGGLNDELRKIGVQYADGKEHCIGYHLIDEPGGGASTRLVGDYVRSYRKADPERYPFVNLLPSYAGEAVLCGTYRAYAQGYVDAAGKENVGYLSHDYYVFRDSGESMTVFADMEVIRSVAYENGKLKTHAFPQSTKWNGMRMPDINEMRWNVYAYLTYGFKALSWFNVVCPGQSDTEGEGFCQSLIYRDGTVTDRQLWADFTDLNWEVRGLSRALMNLDTVHAYHTAKVVKGTEALPDDYFIRPSDSKANFVISYMLAKDGTQPYVMLFNKSFTDSVEASFCLAPTSGVKAVEYLDPFTGEYVPMDVADGCLNDTFRPGEGKLYRLRGDIVTV